MQSDSCSCTGEFSESVKKAGIMSVFALTLISALPCTQFIYQTSVLSLSDVSVSKFPVPQASVCETGRLVFGSSYSIDRID